MRRVATCAALLAVSVAVHPADVDWPAYGGDAAKTRHSPLAQIDRGNVKRLVPAWSDDTGEKGDTQTQPVVVGRTLFGYTPTHKAFALDAASGGLIRTFDPGIPASARIAAGCIGRLENGRPKRNGACSPRSARFVYALDPETGKPIDSFGVHGRIDLAADLGRDPATQSVRLTSPGVVWRDLPILGSRVGESAGIARSRARLRRAQRRAALARSAGIPGGFDALGHAQYHRSRDRPLRLEIPFGEFPELAARGLKDTGSENYGGLLFIAATIRDRNFRAFHKRSGEWLWEAALPAPR